MATYYFTVTDSDLVPVTGDSYKALTGGVAAATPSNFIIASATATDIMAWSTDPGSPNNPDWPNGSYAFSLNVRNITATLTARCKLYRVDSAGGIQQTLGTGPDFNVTGIHTGSFATNPTAGLNSDRYQMRINADNSDTMMASSITADCDGINSYITFPDIVVDTGSSNDVFSYVFLMA